MRNRDNRKPFRGVVGTSPPENSDTQAPLFSFEKMVVNGYSVSCCAVVDQAALSRKLFTLSSLKWRDILQSPRHGLGSEKIARASLRVAVPISVTDDVTFLAIRFNNKKPMVGYREGRIFHVLFLDHDFTVYNHG